MPRRMKYVIQNKLVLSWTKTASSSLPKSRHGAAGSWVWCTMTWSPSTIPLPCHFSLGGCRFLILTVGLYMLIQLEKRCFHKSGQPKHIICRCIVNLTWWSFKDPWLFTRAQYQATSHPHCTWCRLPASTATNWHEPTDSMVCYITTYWLTLWPYPRPWSIWGTDKFKLLVVFHLFIGWTSILCHGFITKRSQVSCKISSPPQRAPKLRKLMPANSSWEFCFQIKVYDEM